MELRKALEEPSTPPNPYAEQLPSTSGEHDGTEADFFIPEMEAEDDEEEALSEQPLWPDSSFGGAVTPDTMPRVKCVVCSALKSRYELRAMWKGKSTRRNLTLFACLLLNKGIAIRTAIRLYNIRSSLQRFCCNVHFVDAARLIEEQLKKETVCLIKAAPYLLSIPVELLDLLMKQATRIDKNITLNARDISLFYRECLGKFHDGNDWTIEESKPTQPPPQTSETIKRTLRSRKRALEEDDQVQIPIKTVNTDVETEGSEAPRCDICWETQKTKLCEDTLRPSQKLVLLTCLVLYNTTYFEVAKSMLREAEKETSVCKSHIIMAMLYMYQYVKRKWNITSTTFFGLGDENKLDLFNHISACALKLQEKAEICGSKVIKLSRSILEKFYNSNERKYKLIAKMKACKEDKNEAIMDIVRNAINEASQLEKPVASISQVVLERRRKQLALDEKDRKAKSCRSPNVFKSIVVERPWSVKRKYLKDFPHNRLLCELCGSERFKEDIRRVSTKTGQINVLLACLLKQALVDEKAAKSIQKDGSWYRGRCLCHEHFIYAGAYLGAAVRKLIGRLPAIGLCYLPIETLLDIVDTLQEQLNSIIDCVTETDIIVTRDVTLFFDDYLRKYVESDEWEILEFPSSVLEQVEAAGETQPLYEGDLFSNDVNRDGVAVPVKEENEKQASIAVKQETSDVYSVNGANFSSQLGLPNQEAKLESDNIAAVEENADMELDEAGPSPQSEANVEQETYMECKADTSSRFVPNIEPEKIMEVNEASSSSQSGSPIEQETKNDNEASSSLVPNLNLEQTSMDLDENISSLLSHYATCSLCAAHGHKDDFLRISLPGRSVVILLSCMVINETCDLTQAKKLMQSKKLDIHGISHYEMCKWHFSVAVTSVFNEYKQLRLQEGSRWLYDVPVEELRRRQRRFQAMAAEISTRWVSIKHANLKQFSAELRGIVSGETHQEVPEEASTDQQSETGDHGVNHICDESSAEKFQKDTEPDSIQSNNHEEQTACSATDEEHILESTSHEEVSAMALMEHPPIPDVDKSLGTSGVCSESGTFEASSKQSNNVATDLQSIALFHFQRGISAETATAEIVTTFGASVVTEDRMKKWYEEFRKKCAQSVAGGATPISQTDKRLIKASLQSDPIKPISELAEEFGVSVDTVISCLQMSGIPKSFKKILLTEQQQRERLETCSALIIRQSREHDFMERIVTYGEIWLGDYKRYRTLISGVHGSYPIAYSTENAMLGVFWATCGVLHYFLLPAGYKMTTYLFINQLNAMHEKLLGYKRTLISDRGGLLMLLDSRLPYMSLGALQALHQNGYELLPLPEICYDLLPTEYHFAKRIRDYVAKQSCYGDSQLAKCINNYFQLETVHFYISGIHDLVTRWKKCYAARGDFFTHYRA